MAKTNDPTPTYTLDKPTGWVTMADGSRFNPWTNEGCENLTLEQVQVYLQERPPAAPEDTESTHENLVREYVMLENRTAPDLARMAEIKKVLRDLDYGTHDLAGIKVAVGHNSTLVPAAFISAYPADQHPHLYKTVPNPAAIKDSLSPAEIKALSKEGEKRLTFK